MNIHDVHKGKQDVKNGSSTLLEKSLLVLFLVKPVIDLFWSQYFVVGGLTLSALHITGFLIFLYFSILRIQYPQYIAPYASIFRLFIIANIVSAVTSVFLVDVPKYIKVVDLLLRMLDSYVLFNIAYILGMTKRYESYYPFIKAIFIGSAIAAIVNVAAIAMGFGGHIMQGTLERHKGIYSDPGALANVAMYGLVFAAVLFEIAPKKSFILRFSCVGIVPVYLYLIFISLSRMNLILVFVFSVLYVGLYKKTIGAKLSVIGFAAGMVIFGSVVMGLNYGAITERFGNELIVLSEEESEYASGHKGDVSFGAYERLGSGRVALWALTLDAVLKRDAFELMVGNFYKTAPSHSDYFDILFRNGIVGLVLYLLMLFLIERKLFVLTVSQRDKSFRYVYFLGFVLMTAHILNGFPYRPITYTTTAWYMWVMLGFSLARMKMQRQAPAETRIKDKKSNARFITAKPFRAPLTSSRTK